MSRQVDSIVEQIERLDETDRRLLELKLQEMADAQWRRESETRADGCVATRNRSAGDRQSRRRATLSTMKVFFDTNVYVAEALLGGAAEQMLDATVEAQPSVDLRCHEPDWRSLDLRDFFN